MRPEAALLAWALAAQAPTLVLGPDQAPKKLHAPVAGHPGVARQARVEGLVLLAVTLNEDGQPAEIQVMRGVPLLDVAAIEAVIRWRYEPTIVNGVRRRVQLVEVIDFFFDDGGRLKGHSGLALDKQQPAAARLQAISRLVQLPPKRQKAVAQTLERLSRDDDPVVVAAAEAGLVKLLSAAK